MSGATIIAEAFGEGADLYTDVLGVDQSATAAQLRKAYYQKALLYHPDKQTANGDENDAKAKFQAISVAYEVLKDPEKRAEYDDTGELFEDDELSKSGTDIWRNYFSSIFGKVTTSDIDNFAAKYKCSEEEEKDVLKYYQQFKGNLDKMLNCVMLSNECDKKRWVEDFIQPAIDKGDVEDYGKMLKKTMSEILVEDMDETETETEEEEAQEEEPPKKKAKSKKKVAKKAKASKAKRRAQEAAEAEALMSKIRNKHSLAQRQAGFENMISGIKDRYGTKDDDPLGDDEFEKVQARMLAQGKLKGRKKKA